MAEPDEKPVFHVNPEPDQTVIARIDRQIGILSRAARKAWRTRKRMEAARALRAGNDDSGPEAA